MRTGRPAKSAKALELAGTARPDRPRKEQANFTPLLYVPDAPDWLSGDEVATGEWKRLAPLLINDGTLAEKDLQTLANLCAMQSRIMRNFRGDKNLDGTPINAAGCMAAYAKLASALGLASGWRPRVVSGEKSKPENPFADLKLRPN